VEAKRDPKKRGCKLALRIAGCVFAAAAGVPFADAASSQAYPTKPIRMLTAEVGGGSDFAARLIAQGLSTNLGEQVVVDNRGGGGLVADIVAKAPPDGYTLLLYSSIVWLLPYMREHLPYDPVRDLAAISLVASSPHILVTPPSLTVASVQDVIALAKAKPGALNYCSGPSGTSLHLTGELFKITAGVDIVHVPYKGVGAALTDLMAGRVQMMFPTPGSVAQHIKSGRLKAFAVTSLKPSPLLPGLPTLAASGLPGFESISMIGLFAPARTPVLPINRLHKGLVAVLNSADVKDKFFNVGVETVGSTPAQFATTIKSEMAKWSKVIKSAGIRAE
jgi:tripartite-type tricarboxylate transporter receptor subunit TctC